MLRLLVLLIFLIPQFGRAEERCPKSISPTNPIRKVTNESYPIPLNKEIRVESNGDYYRIPAGYFTAWPLLKTNKPNVFGLIPLGINPDEAQHYPGIDVAFWMPSLRFPERQYSTTLSFRFCEDGRPPATLDQPEYVVNLIVHKLPGMDGELSPSQKFNNRVSATSSGGGKANYKFTDEYGLLRYSNKTLSAKSPPEYTSYTNVLGTSPEVLMDCREFNQTPKMPATCQGYFYFPKKRLHFVLRFDRQDLPKWRQNLDAAAALLERWKIDNKKILENTNKEK